MATRGDVPGKKGDKERHSVDCVDYLCLICAEKNVNKEAVKYCVSCEGYYCEECVKLHDIIPTLAKHVIVGKSDFKGGCNGDKLPSVPTERCELHKLKIVDMMCKTHDQVGCATCMATKHK